MDDLITQRPRTLCGRSFNNIGLARAAGVSPPYLCQLLKGRKTNPSEDILKRLARALGVDVQRLKRELNERYGGPKRKQ